MAAERRRCCRPVWSDISQETTSWLPTYCCWSRLSFFHSHIITISAPISERNFEFSARTVRVRSVHGSHTEESGDE